MHSIMINLLEIQSIYLHKIHLSSREKIVSTFCENRYIFNYFKVGYHLIVIYFNINK